MNKRHLGFILHLCCLTMICIVVRSIGAAVLFTQVDPSQMAIHPTLPARSLDFDSDGIMEIVFSSNGQDLVGALASHVEIQGIRELPPDLGAWATPLEYMEVVSATSASLGSWIVPNGTNTFGLRTATSQGTFSYWPQGYVFVPDGGLGSFTPVSGYLAVRFQQSDGIHYGWVEIGVDSSAAYGYLRSYAWETTPNTPIIAGSVPEPGRMALLMLGCVCWQMRRRRAAVLDLFESTNLYPAINAKVYTMVYEADPDAYFTVQVSTDLMTWTDVSTVHGSATATINAVDVPVPLSASTTERHFWRLKRY